MRQNVLFQKQNTLPFGKRNTPFKNKVQGGFEWSKSFNHTLMTNINANVIDNPWLISKGGFCVEHLKVNLEISFRVINNVQAILQGK